MKTVCFKKYQSPIGDLFLYSHENKLVAVLFDAKTRMFQSVNLLEQTSAIIEKAIVQLEEYFAGKRVEFDLDLELTGTDFQKKAWQALTTIPFGQTVTYGEQARKINAEKAVRAIGAANGKNPISIIVPCHRVIGANGKLTGYAGGLDTKSKLLALEGICQGGAALR